MCSIKRIILVAALLLATSCSTQPRPTGPTAEFVAATNSVALRILKTQTASDKNLVFSPLSISLVMSMVYGGARGETAVEMGRALQLDSGLHPQAARVAQQLRGYNVGATKMHVASRLFSEKTYTLQDSFKSLMRETYRSPIESVDFKHNSEPARKHINKWISKQTNQKIPTLLPKGSLNKTTRLVLTNAIYFLGKWKVSFSPSRTRNRSFHSVGEDVQVPFMHVLSPDFHYMADDKVQVLEMRYLGENLGMTVILPKERGSLAHIERDLTIDQVNRWIRALRSTKVQVALPKFKFKRAMDLKGILKTLGVRLAFDCRKADLTGIAPLQPEDRLFIDEVYHEALIEVDERGTEAVAATAALATGIYGLTAPSHKVFIADHPFLFLIRDLHSGAILFIGRVARP